MNLDRLINMVINRVIRTLVNKGVNAGIDAGSSALAKRRKPGDEAVLTEEEQRQQTQDQARMAAQGKKAAKNARQFARMGRRIGKF
ncbi:MAG: hypothetical protein HWE33_14785 [Rhodobacteraceae bacterium]|nr:hypothetical protein [Paracoccaceae bacterium]